MNSSRLIQALRSPFSGPTTTGPRASALPPDLLREARRRLGVLARLLMALALINLTLGHTLFPRLHVGWPVVADLVVVGVAVLSLGVFLYTRRAHTHAASFVTLGLVYEVAVVAAVATVEHASISAESMSAGPTVSRVCLVILMFAAIVPSTPSRTLLTALIAASLDPLAMAIAIAARHLSVAPAHLLWMHIPDVLAVAVATLISTVITRLGREVRDARELGSYRLGALLGRGGMGEVYVAHHRMLARPAAIKLIRPEKLELRDDGHAERAVQRFKREAEAAASLRSPHTIELYDFGETDDGTLYFVMELLDGIDLESLVDRFGPVPPARAVHVLRQVCASLAEAHAHGLVHRDVKPANIHLCRMGLEYDFVKVLDFGIVKSRHPPAAGQAAATAADKIIGTPAFMPPEMAAGDAVDGRADLYGLGCVAYWLLTGRLVFDGETAYQVVAQHLNAAPEPPSHRSPHAISATLDGVILSCLEKDPAQRPQDALELSHRLIGCEFDAPWTEEEAARWWQAHLPQHNRSAVDGAIEPVPATWPS